MANKPQNMTELFEKLDDLKSVFVYGQKIIPVIQNLVDFMKDTVPLLENINQSIEQTQKQFPKAQNKIDDVTNATEIATTQILDKVDLITSELETANVELSDLLSKAHRKDELIDKLITEHPDLKDELDALRFNGTKEIIENHIDTLNKINTNTYDITMALQVQDITSQQLSAVNHFINSVQHRLTSLLTDIDGKELNAPDTEGITEVTFDEDASYLGDSNQNLADEMFDKETKNTASQDEIDKLFSS